ncbi:GNAT family N-acetyltransferase [Deefgea sp. CFH1-16]|uniref:GNAT family N-acetyltransferase n=1 Tax=Deefgea sp. CFH1-16 TaxID=2675457 RepID=UPI0015F60B05|nr:GNAT family N-acetyltransferase [Deefgea sp. CFH1-16]MBM5573555.1 GNAT family N-acetyltransferase [Deefgea sp. CFH1-16]
MNDDVEIFIGTQSNVVFSELVWDVFFKSRERGISLKKHFPFLLSGSDNIYFILCKKAGRVIGGLVLKRCVHAEIGAYGIIGLVCVESEFRGCGIAKLLLDRSIKFSKDIGLSACTLWTRFPAVYIRQGFEMVGKAFSGSIDFF